MLPIAFRVNATYPNISNFHEKLNSQEFMDTNFFKRVDEDEDNSDKSDNEEGEFEADEDPEEDKNNNNHKASNSKEEQMIVN
jgi:hypothetical protein